MLRDITVKTFSFMLCFICLLQLCGCSSKEIKDQVDNEKVNNSEQNYEKDRIEDIRFSFTVNKQIYESQNLSINSVKLLKDGIEFNIENKTNENISLFLNIALDGIGAAIWDTAELSPNETKDYKLRGTINYPEHKLLSMVGYAFIDNAENEAFEICDFDLGGKVNIEKTYPDGELLYESDNLVVEYLGADGSGVNFKVVNNRLSSITFGFDEFKINEDSNDYAINVITIPGHTTDKYSVDILSMNADFFASNLKSFNGIMKADVSGEGIVDRFPVSYHLEDNTSENIPLSNNTLLMSPTYSTYNTMINLSKEDLTGSKGNWSYNGLPLLSDDCDLIDRFGFIDPGVIYDKMAMCLLGFSMGNTWTQYAEMLIGYTPDSREEFEPFVQNASEFIVAEDQLMAIMHKFETLDSVQGEFDYDYKKLGKYSLDISNLTECAEELQISEEMLGYTLAKLVDFAAEITFNDNSCHVEYTSYV